MKTSIFDLFILMLLLSQLFACKEEMTFKSPCDLCQGYDFNELSYALQGYLHAEKSLPAASPLFLSQIDSAQQALMSGYKMIRCGCTGEMLTYHLWCAGDETYALDIRFENENFILYTLRQTTFEHP